MKTIVLTFLVAMNFWACKNLTEEDLQKFSYDEHISLFGSAENNPRNWNLSCDGLQCKITYSTGTPLKIRYEKQVVLSSEEEKKRIVNSLIKGLKNGKNFSDTQDYAPKNHLILNHRKEYHGQTQNEEFYKILNNLLGENHENIIQKYFKN